MLQTQATRSRSHAPSSRSRGCWALCVLVNIKGGMKYGPLFSEGHPCRLSFTAEVSVRPRPKLSALLAGMNGCHEHDQLGGHMCTCLPHPIINAMLSSSGCCSSAPAVRLTTGLMRCHMRRYAALAACVCGGGGGLWARLQCKGAATSRAVGACALLVCLFLMLAGIPPDPALSPITLLLHTG